MSNTNPVFTWSTTIIITLLVQVIIVAMLISSMVALGAGSALSVDQIPPVNFIYASADMDWIGAGRIVAHTVVAIATALVGIYCLWYALSRKLKVVRYIVFALGLQSLISCLTNIALIGLIAIGGWWHIATFVADVAVAISATASAVIFAMLHRQLHSAGSTADALFGLKDSQ